jgi:hypothetical protein
MLDVPHPNSKENGKVQYLPPYPLARLWGVTCALRPDDPQGQVPHETVGTTAVRADVGREDPYARALVRESTLVPLFEPLSSKISRRLAVCLGRRFILTLGAHRKSRKQNGGSRRLPNLRTQRSDSALARPYRGRNGIRLAPMIGVPVLPR